MYIQQNKTKLAYLFRTLMFGIFLVVLSVNGVNAQPNLRITDSNPMAMPSVGAYDLRILTPTLLELTLISSKTKDGAVTNWNFVSNGALSAPATSEFQVTAGNQTIGVQSVGFKRRPLYAPLNYRDLRIDNKIYLQLSSGIPEGQTVTVKNASGKLFGADKNYTATADPFRFNPAIHVSHEGYMPNHVKKAMVGYYLGSMGEMSIPAGGGYRIISISNGAVVHTGSLTLRRDIGYTYSPTPYQQVYEADFTSFKTPGEYRLQVPGMGASFAFMIGDGIAGTFARGYALGLYHQRCGHANDYPHSRHQKGACHRKPVLVPDGNFTAVNNTLASVTGDFANSQSGAPQLRNVNSSLYPFINRTAFDASGGHHDAGDYSKYTINVAQLAHSLMFAVDSFQGVAALDNLGLPESGDGISDVMQTAKWELDFLAKLQDADGGFYFLVYPKDRRYEDNVSLTGTDLGDQQVVFPKTTAATAASVAALAQAASSPRFKAAYPNEAAAYLAKAKKGWQFLENAWAKYGRDGAYQKITHYGNEFRDRDEIAWAACEMFLATGEAKYHTELTSRFDPANPNTRRWSWWRLFESYGCAVRSYAFAARSGRLPASALNATYLAKCEAEIIAAGDDQVKYSNDSAYANPFPTWNKPYRSSGWFMSVEQTYDVVTAYQLVQKQAYINTLIGAINYEAGNNPLNMGFLTGVGWKRQRETVNQYAANDRRILPPSGIPLGSVWPGTPNIWQYGSELNSLVFPTDSTSANNMFAPYEKWTDTFHVATEMVNPQQGRSLGSTAWLMAQTSLKTQPWKAATATITGLPSSTPANQNITIGLTSPGVDLSQATIVWEARDQEPTPGSTFTFAPKNTGAQWVEAEALLPDGRRVFAKADFNATTATDTKPNTVVSSPWTVSSEMVALYHLDNSLADSVGKQSALTRVGNAVFDSSNLGWMQSRSGAALQFRDVGDQASVSIPFSDTWSSDTQAIIVEAMIYVTAFKGYNKANATILSLERNWNAFMELREDMYAGPVVRFGSSTTIPSSQVNAALPRNAWHHIRMIVDKNGYTVRINGNTVGSVQNSALNNWNVNVPATLKFGNFDGWVDEVVVRHVRTSSSDAGSGGNPTPTIPAPEPVPTVATPVFNPNGGTFTDSVLVSLSSATSGATIRYTTDGSNPTGGSKAYTSPFTLTTSGTIKAAAFLNGISSSVASASFTVNATPPAPTVATPVFSPNGGTFTDAVLVSLSSATGGATIRYTTDGSTPTGDSRIYSSPLTVTASGTIKAAAYLNGVSSGVASASFTINTSTTGVPNATFVKNDTTSQGDWKGTYGNEGYFIIGDSIKNPSYAQVSASGKADWMWRASTPDVKGLLKANSTTDRVLSVWYSDSVFNVDVNITDGKTHRMSAYFLDWDNLGRAQTVQILDRNTGAVLNSQTVSGFANGRYISWDISGSVRMKVTRTAGANAVMSGLFFDAAGVNSTPPPTTVSAPVISPNGGTFTDSVSVTMTTSTSGATIRYTTDGSNPTSTSTAYAGAFTLTSSRTVKAAAFLNGTSSAVTTATFNVVPAPVLGTTAKFVRADTSTRGTWKGVYGTEGYTIIGNAMKVPTYTQAYPSGKTDWTWQASTTDINGLQKETGTDRILAVWTAPKSFTVTMNITDNKRHRLSLYFCDWDKRGRSQTIEVIDANSGKVLNKQSISSFTSGRYLTWEVSGNIRVRVTRTGSSNVVMSGLFFDPATTN